MATRNDVVGTLFVRLEPVSQGFAESVKAVIDRAEQQVALNLNTQGAQNGLEAINAGLVNAAAQAALFEEAMRRVGNAVVGVVNTFGGLFDTISRARIGFENVLGPQIGEQLLQSIRVLARETPFENESLISYSQQLIGVGLEAEKLIPILTTVGDLVFSVGGGQQQIDRVLYALSQVQAAGRLIGQDALQFQNALIPITRIISEYLEISQAEVKELQRQGEISSEVVFAALQQAGTAVEGAMLRANETVAGSLEILRGTIETFLQDQPVLQEIYADILTGINSITDIVQDPEFGTRVENFFSAFETVYQQLQPFLDGLTGAGGRLALLFLESFTSIMEILGGVLEGIPEPVLNALGQFFAAQAALKAPVALLGYATGLGRIGQALAGGTLATNLNRTTTAMNQQAAAAQRAAFANSRLGASIQAAGAIAVIAGGQFAQAENDAVAAAGSALSGAGFGASIGAAFGPQGALIGAAGGAIIGGITSLFSSARKEAEAFQQEMIENGREFADEYTREFNARFGGETTSNPAFEGFFSDIEAINLGISQGEEQIESFEDAIASALETLSGIYSTPEGAGVILPPDLQQQVDELYAQIDSYQGAIREIQNDIKQSNVDIEALFAGETGQEVINFMNQVAANLRVINTEANLLGQVEIPEGSGFLGSLDAIIARGLLAGNFVVDTQEDFEILSGLLDQLGLDIAEIGSSTDNLQPIIDDLTNVFVDGFTQGLNAINDFNTGLDIAQEKAEATIGSMITQFQAFQDVFDARQDINEAFGNFFELDPNNVITQITPNVEAIADAGEAILDSAAARFNVTFAQVFSETQDEAAATTAAVEASNSVIIASFAAVQAQLGLSTQEFEDFLAQAGLLEQFRTAAQGAGDTMALSFRAAVLELDITAEHLKEIVDIQGDIDPRTTITVTADVAPALEELQRLQERLANLSFFEASGTLGVILRQRIEELESFIDENITAIIPDTEEARADQQKRIDQLEEAAEKINETFTDQVARLGDILAPEDTRALAEQAASARAESARLSAAAQAQIDILQSLISGGITEANREAIEDQQELVNDLLGEAAAARSNAESLTSQARAEAERLAREAEQLAREAEREREQYLRQLEQANESLTSAITDAATQIEDAAQEWIGAITERTQFERAVSITAATRNANRQADQIAQLNAGLDNLLARGVSEAVIQALDINNVSDLRQVNRLVGSTDAELAALTSAVGRRDQAALSLAQEREQETAKRTITAAILNAFEILGVEEAGQARALIENLTITPDTDANALAAQIIALITSNTVTR